MYARHILLAEKCRPFSPFAHRVYSSSKNDICKTGRSFFVLKRGGGAEIHQRAVFKVHSNKIRKGEENKES